MLKHNVSALKQLEQFVIRLTTPMLLMYSWYQNFRNFVFPGRSFNISILVHRKHQKIIIYLLSQIQLILHLSSVTTSFPSWRPHLIQFLSLICRGFYQLLTFLQANASHSKSSSSDRNGGMSNESQETLYLQKQVLSRSTFDFKFYD